MKKVLLLFLSLTTIRIKFNHEITNLYPMKKSLILILWIIFSTIISQAQTMVFPAIQGYGGVIPVPFETEKPDPSKQYKFVIELGNKLEDKTKVADLLDYAARMYNLHRFAGVPKENIELAIVIYAGSTPIVFANPTYRKKFDKADSNSALVNPNSSLLDEFLRNGIQVIVCGQSMMKQNLLPADIYPGVRMAVSRLTATTDLVQKGYHVIIL